MPKVSHVSLRAIEEAIEGAYDALMNAKALQELINGGHWSFEGAIGRAMMRAIEEGRCCLGPLPARDYWGNAIPARDWVKEGTKGSLDYVEKRMGKAWRDAIAKV